MTDWKQWREQVDLDDYDARWQQMAAAGENPHGEADYVVDLLGPTQPAAVLDAGCGTGRLAIELDRRGIDTVGVDQDEDLLGRARTKAPNLAWVLTNLADLNLGRTFDAVVLAGNVVPFIETSDRPEAITRCARHVNPNGFLLAGFQLRPTWPSVDDYDTWCASVGLKLDARYSSWTSDAFESSSDYAVSVHRWKP
ncbi:MAG: class I SAM-dependent methyltransferase [Actinomycetes bacterium]